MRPLDKSTYTENKTSYTPYGDAKPDLINALGPFCSYCEREGFSTALDVEHVEDKDDHPDKKYKWDNFVLACKNCNSIKGKKKIEFDNIFLPHLKNTFRIFEYCESGLVKICSTCSQYEKAKNLMELVGLDRRPGHPKYSNKDHRWEERKKCWELAKRYQIKYEQGNADSETIKDLALKAGFWSIWMHAFSEFPEVQKELINAFPGTNKNYFQDILNS